MYQTFVHAPVIAKLCALFILALFGYFVCWFIPRAVLRGIALKRIIGGLMRLEAGADPAPLFEKNKDLAHLWSEYDETLFKQERFDSQQRDYVFDKKRSTVPAEMFFNTQTTVDSYVGAEFFKHVPGILTGIGIIGTFFGILHGLDAFNVSADAAQVRDSLKGLLGSVSEAFAVSAGAIACAMIITLLEKWLLANLYKKSEALAIEIDKLYKAGAGEEMLQDLVQSSADYVSNSKSLKDALVSDLKGILTQLTESQIQAQRGSTEDLGRQIGEHITQGLERALAEPMKAVAAVVGDAAKERSGAVHSLLSEVVKELNQSLRDLFGDQIAGINTMQQQTIAALQSAVVKMEQMSASLATAGTDATAKMAEQLADAVTKMEASQAGMTRHMAQIVEEMRSSVASSQNATNDGMLTALKQVSTSVESLVGQLTEKVTTSQDASNEKMQQAFASVAERIELLMSSMTQTMNSSQTATNDQLQKTVADVSTSVRELVSGLSESVVKTQAESSTHLTQSVATVGDSVKSMVADLKEQAAGADAANEKRQRQLAENAQNAAAAIKAAVESLTSEIHGLVAGTNKAVEVMRSSVDAMRAVTNDTVSKMNLGADTLHGASTKFEEAGKAVTGAFEKATSVTDSLAAAAGNVGAASQTMQAVVSDYRARCDEFQSELDQLETIVTFAKDSLSQDVLKQIQESSKALNTAQLGVQQFMNGVADVLATSSKEFKDNMTSTMADAVGELVNSTSRVTSLLGRTIQELAVSVRPVVPDAEAY
ncbi:Apolipoprotein A1/A4/E domain protein [Caballeronia pedi]|uniref:Apolipoprotein A1/A4/E domain protein n=1 Tax=Caballeronia pedi TaxID=1777141 RepID=A0A157ZUP0_9BURK|nr:anti-phage ZorAB system protein ZorA [Caballeronia pedi]SAK49274.1 Apolipoprotein A1/A4/E domain protein [Caballeronia pedi]